MDQFSRKPVAAVAVDVQATHGSPARSFFYVACSETIGTFVMTVCTICAASAVMMVKPFGIAAAYGIACAFCAAEFDAYCNPAIGFAIFLGKLPERSGRIIGDLLRLAIITGLQFAAACAAAALVGLGFGVDVSAALPEVNGMISALGAGGSVTGLTLTGAFSTILVFSAIGAQAYLIKFSPTDIVKRSNFIGYATFLCAICTLPYVGIGLNPAFHLGVGALSSHIIPFRGSCWIYYIGPYIGAMVAVAVWKNFAIDHVYLKSIAKKQTL